MDRRLKVFRIVALLAVLMGLSACAVKQVEPVKAVMSDAEIVSELAGRLWVAESILGLPVIDMSHTSMVFTESDLVKGRGGCNSFSGTYAIKGGMITFGPIAATMRLCAAALDNQEMRFFQSLDEPLTVKFENGLLYLVPAEGKPSVFAMQD